MNVHSTAPTDPDTFLRWNEGREGKRELVNGKIIEMMTGGTRRHAMLTAQLLVSLRERLDRSSYIVVPSDLGVKTAAGVRYPDVLVDRKGGGGADLTANAPVLIAEILSWSSHRTDLGEKAQEYTALDSLDAYVVLAQEEPRAWLWLRGHELGPPVVLAGIDALLEVPSLALRVPLSELYRDLMGN